MFFTFLVADCYIEFYASIMDTKTCKKCGTDKQITKFKQTKQWRGNVCQECRNTQRVERYHTVEKNDPGFVEENRQRAKSHYQENREAHYATSREWRNTTEIGYWTNKITSIKANCRARGLDCTVDWRYLKALFDNQFGLCKLTGVPLVLSRKKRELHTCSVDRIKNNLGYIEGNVRLVTLQANFAKSEGNDLELIEFCKRVLISHGHSIVKNEVIHRTRG